MVVWLVAAAALSISILIAWLTMPPKAEPAIPDRAWHQCGDRCGERPELP